MDALLLGHDRRHRIGEHHDRGGAGPDRRRRVRAGCERCGDGDEEKRDRGDEKPGPGRPAAEGEEVARVVDEERETHPAADEGVRLPPLAPEQDEAGCGRKQQWADQEEPLVREEQLEGDAAAGNAHAEEAAAVGADHVVAGLSCLDHRIRVRERQRRTERPGIEGEERDHAEKDAAGVRQSATHRPLPGEHEPREDERDQPGRKLDDDGEPCEGSGRKSRERPRDAIALAEKHAEGGEGERCGKDMREEEASEWEQQRPETAEDGGQAAVPWRDSIAGPANEEEEKQQRQRCAEHAHLPQGHARHQEECVPGSQPGSRVRDVEVRRAQEEVPRLGEERQAGGLGGIEMPVDV